MNSPPIQRRCAPSIAPVRSIRGSVEANGAGFVAALDQREQLDELVAHGVEHVVGGRTRGHELGGAAQHLDLVAARSPRGPGADA